MATSMVSPAPFFFGSSLFPFNLNTHTPTHPYGASVHAHRPCPPSIQVYLWPLCLALEPADHLSGSMVSYPLGSHRDILSILHSFYTIHHFLISFAASVYTALPPILQTWKTKKHGKDNSRALINPRRVKPLFFVSSACLGSVACFASIVCTHGHCANTLHHRL